MTNWGIKLLQAEAVERLQALQGDVESLRLFDFPDYSNIGDSAIAAGQFAFWKRIGTQVKQVISGPGVQQRDLTGHTPVVLQGGGNLGSLYPPMQQLRLRVLLGLPEGVPIIQFPQSVFFDNDVDRAAFQDAVASRKPEPRWGVRDQNSYRTLSDLVPNVIRVPDAAHALGELPAPDATQPVFVLARQDAEVAAADRPLLAQDWPTGGLPTRALHRVKYSGATPDALRVAYRRTPDFWRRQAFSRLARGVKILSVGETVVTDRLHGMLLALQMGRRVVAIDNNNGKLSDYVRTWHLDHRLPVQLADNFTQALQLANAPRPL